MQLLLFKTFKKRTDSTKLVDISRPDKTCDVYLKRETVYSSPVFTIESEEYPVYTYAYLVPLQSYYFVVSRKQQNVGYWEIGLKLDPLATFRAEIAAYNCFIERCADARYYNTDIEDSALSVEDVVEHHSEATTGLFTTTGAYVLRLVGRDTSGVATFAFRDLSSIGNVFNPIFSNMFDDGSFDWHSLEIGDLVQALLCDPAKYITGAYYSPIALGDYAGHGGLNQVYLGFFPTGQSGLQVSSDPVITKSVSLAKPAGIYSDFRKTDKSFSEYTMYLPAIGTVSLSPDIMDSALTLDAAIDLLTGNVFYKLSAGGALVATYNGNCYAPLQLGNGDASGGTAFISDVISAGKGVATKDVGDAASGVIKGIKDFISPTPSINGSQGGVASMKYKPDVVISVLQKSSAEFPVNQVGRPCCKNLLIGSLQGFVKCGNPSIELAAESDIIDEVNNYLANGFYFE
jgi:hypothetical protein